MIEYEFIFEVALSDYDKQTGEETITTQTHIYNFVAPSYMQAIANAEFYQDMLYRDYQGCAEEIEIEYYES